MKQKIVFAIAGFVLLTMNDALAQSYSEEALMLSRTRPGGSARILGMGGVQNSLGGDISSAYYNPAGLGMYNRSEFTLTPGYSIANTSASYLGNTDSGNKTNLMVPNMGIAFHSGKDGSKGFWGGTFAINFNRINDFNNTAKYHGLNKDSSIIDYFLDDATGATTSQFNTNGNNYNTPTGLSYFNYLIGPLTILNPSNPPDQYFTDVYPYLPTQSEVIKTSGAQNQWSFSYGVNFNDKIFLGAGVGIASFSYTADKTYTETFYDQYFNPDGTTIPKPFSPMTKMVLNESLSLSGSGINATLGAIFRPIDMFQFGVSFATPTSYSISDNYSASMTTAWNNFVYVPGKTLTDEDASTDIVTSNYNLSTPWRVSGGGTFFFQKSGFISVDVEWLNYSSTKYSSNTGDDYSLDNQDIKGLYKSVVNLRAGGEYRLNSFRFRGGYNYMPDPFQAPQNGVNRSLSSYSAGFGYRQEKFYIDLAVIFSQGSNSYRPYIVNTPKSPLVTLNSSVTTFAVTVGFPF